MKRVNRYRKPRRVYVFDPKTGTQRSGWAVGRVLVAKGAWEGPVYREIVKLDSGDTIEVA